MTPRSIVFVDIDHTVSDAAWRDFMIGAPYTWDQYHLASPADDPCTDVVRLLLALKAGGNFRLVGLTARPEKWRGLTQRWLFENGVPLEELLMRPDEDYATAPILKVRLAEEYTGGRLDSVAFVLDDREDVAAAFRSKNVTTLQVHGRRYGAEEDLSCAQ